MTTKLLLALFLKMFYIHRTANISLTWISLETINCLRYLFSISLNKMNFKCNQAGLNYLLLLQTMDVHNLSVSEDLY